MNGITLKIACSKSHHRWELLIHKCATTDRRKIPDCFRFSRPKSKTSKAVHEGSMELSIHATDLSGASCNPILIIYWKCWNKILIHRYRCIYLLRFTSWLKTFEYREATKNPLIQLWEAIIITLAIDWARTWDLSCSKPLPCIAMRKAILVFS